MTAQGDAERPATDIAAIVAELREVLAKATPISNRIRDALPDDVYDITENMATDEIVSMVDVIGASADLLAALDASAARERALREALEAMLADHVREPNYETLPSTKMARAALSTPTEQEKEL